MSCSHINFCWWAFKIWLVSWSCAWKVLIVGVHLLRSVWIWHHGLGEPNSGGVVNIWSLMKSQWLTLPILMNLKQAFFRAWLRKLPYLPGAPHLHANKPLEGWRYDSLNRVTRQTAGSCVIFAPRFWHDRSFYHAFVACRRKQAAKCWCTSP